MHPDRHAVSDTHLQLTGVLIRNGEAKVKMIDGAGNSVPVIVLELESESGMHMPLHVEQAFPPGRMDQAEAAARRYQKGQRLTVQASALSARLAVVATHIHTLKDNDEAPCPASPSSP